MRILIISRYPPFPGGRENFVFELVQELSKKNKVLVITPDQMDQKKGKVILKKYRRSIKGLRKIIDEFEPDVINSHTFYLSRHAADLSKKIGIPFSITLHGDQFAIGNRQRQEIVKDIVSLSDFVINVSKNGKDSLIKNIKNINKSKLHVVNNGVNLKKFKRSNFAIKSISRKKLGLANDRTLVLTPVRIASYKGLDFLLDTIIENSDFLKRKGVLFLVSIPRYPFSREEKDLFSSLQKKIKEAQINRLLKFVFLRYDEMPKAYFASDLFLLPSQKEQLPISILEAMASEVPIIATKVGGVPELLSDKVDSFLVNFGDKTTLFRCLKKILNGKAESFSKKAYKKVSTMFSIGRVANEYVTVYKKYIKNAAKTD